MKQQNILHAVQEHSKKLFGFIRSKVNSDEDAEDILQDVWFSFSTLVDTQSIEQIEAWLYRASRNKIIDKNRKKKPLNLEDFLLTDEDGGSYFPKDLLEEVDQPDLELERASLQDLMMAAIQELPEKQRDVFIWNVIDGRSLQQIADATGENLKTIISRKQYAVKKLREKLEHILNQ